MDILIKPLVTEKMNELTEKFRRYGFVVDRRATKPQIKKAVESFYDVKVDSVNTMVFGGKVKSRYTKSGVISGKTGSYKKAIVTLAEGDSIDFYSNI
ncbi:MAG: 50S ribosomal protein L23 [Prolixibacteraceae bacterium]|jgi:large subunit ribosomal protein L23|nr:50S ribosomal protein L23 [Prolixibacteraceae bacterium]MDD4755680.1 50S ribosomal protein L23 [Prolixibacteraceae bacterium]NLO03036.1 50S ribosomal protein L23 [Bacteroidales bacterium]